MDNILYDLYKSCCNFKTIHNINTFVKNNKDKLNNEELKILNENKYLSHSISIVAALSIQSAFYRLRRLKLFIYRKTIPHVCGLLSSCFYLYLHNLYISRNNISKLIILAEKDTHNTGIGHIIKDMLKY
ncbi:hypothetical protein, variant 3 [Plasmodium yoelii 17X]|uniref:Uncharacterized protein n=1 Tax=Plasmodium yoelii 17X TaxID=1323249 RepID=V7PS23_PLAYE|nr:hypothetical protein, variant 2 [Plasmodium yoelii 17X]ETB61567.1 hypothetical protein, variant 3 [Plasmodium yoelii 17X]